MTLAEFYSRQFSTPQDLEFCFRLLVAFIVGAVIGIERSRRFKDAGPRTHILVCCAAALIMLISKYGFADLMISGNMEIYGTRGADAARVAAQAVSGISFLCAGVIIKIGGNIRGLTTAAGIWLTAAVGLAIGAGMYLVSFFTLLLLFILRAIGYRFPFMSDRNKSYRLEVLVKGDSEFSELLYRQLKEWDAFISENKVQRNSDGTVRHELSVHMNERYGVKELMNLIQDREDVISAGIEAFHSHVG